MAFFFKNQSEMPDPKSALLGRDAPIRTANTHFVSGAPLKGPSLEGSEICGLGGAGVTCPIGIGASETT